MQNREREKKKKGNGVMVASIIKALKPTYPSSSFPYRCLLKFFSL